MAHGFGEVIGNAKKVAGETLGTAYDTSKDAISKAGSGFIDNIRKRQDRIANPPMVAKYGDSRYGKEHQFQFQNSWLDRKSRIAAHELKTGAKSFGIGAVLSGGLYGLMAYATDNSDNDAADRGVNVAKYGVAAAADIAADGVLTGVAAGLATFGGPAGIITGGALTAFNMFAGFGGVDAGSMAMKLMDYTEEKYDEVRNGTKFNMTQNTAMSLQRQLGNIAQAGSNLGEIMHN